MLLVIYMQSLSSDQRVSCASENQPSFVIGHLVSDCFLITFQP
jgi:hypothetical protein